MGSSLVKPSRRENLRRGANVASASRSDAQVNTGTVYGQKDEECKVDALTVPISNYCKPVTVVSQNGNIKDSMLCSQEGNHKYGSRSRFKSEIDESKVNLITCKQIEPNVENQDFICPVLKKDFYQGDFPSDPDLFFLNPDLSKTSAPRPVRGIGTVPATGSGDSSTHGLPPISTTKLKPSSRRKRFFSGSCVGRRTNKTPDSDNGAPDSHDKCSIKDESKSKEVALPLKVLESEHGDQDVCRDARTPSPEYNDFENVIVTEPTSVKTRTCVSSPVDCYVHTNDVEANDEISSEGISIKKSNIPAPLHHGERRCELNETLAPDLSSSTLNSEHAETHIERHGDPEATRVMTASSKTKIGESVPFVIKPDAFLEQGDSISDRKDNCVQHESKTINICSNKDKQLTYGYEDETALQISDSLGDDEDVHSTSKANPILISVKPIKEYSSAENEFTADETELQSNKDEHNLNVESERLETTIGDYTTYSKRDDQKSEQRVYICGALNFETSPLEKRGGLEECAVNATKCLCDLNQFDFDNGDDISKSKSIHVSTDVTDKKILGLEGKESINTTGDLGDLGARGLLTMDENKREHDFECLEVLPNNMEPNLIGLTRLRRLNCWRSSDEFRLDREKQRPASWSHTRSENQAETQQTTTRPFSAATGGSTMFGNDGALGKPINPLDSSSVDQRASLKTNSTHDVESPRSAQSVTSSGRLQRSRPTSAQSSRRSAVDCAAQLSHHSLGQVSAQNSRHSLSRSLSNHSSGCHNAMHSPRPPSTDPKKHPPRPPSAQSGEVGPRKFKSRLSLVHVSGSTTPTAKQPSNHSIGLEPVKTPSYQKLQAQSLNLPALSSDRNADQVAGRGSLATSLNFENPVKLPPIKASPTGVTAPRPVTEPWTIPSHPVRLPPVVTARSGVGEADEQSARTGDLATVNFSRGSVLPPVPGAEDEAKLEKLSAEHWGSKTTECGTQYSYMSNSHTSNSLTDDQKTTGAEAKDNACIPSPLPEDARLDESERGDPKPSPTDSHSRLDKSYGSLSTASVSNAEDISRLLATYLPHKYSVAADTSAPAGDCHTTDSPGALTNQTTVGTDDCMEKSALDQAQPDIGYTKYISILSNVSKQEYSKISNEEKDASYRPSSYVKGNCSETLTCSLSEGHAEYRDKKSEFASGSAHHNSAETKADVKNNETTTDWISSSPVMNDKSILAKLSTSVKEDSNERGNFGSISEEKTEMDETLKNVSDTGSELRSTHCKSPLEKYATDVKHTQAGTESPKPMHDDKEEGAVIEPCNKLLSEDKAGFSYNYLNGHQEYETINDSPLNCLMDRVFTEEKPTCLTQSNDPCQLSSPVAALMAKYSSAIETKNSNLEEVTDTHGKTGAMLSKETNTLGGESNTLIHGLTELDKGSIHEDNSLAKEDAYLKNDDSDEKPKEDRKLVEHCTVTQVGDHSVKESANFVEQAATLDISSILAKYSYSDTKHLADSGKNVSDTGDDRFNMDHSKLIEDSSITYTVTANNECLDERKSPCKSTCYSIEGEQSHQKSPDMSEDAAVNDSFVESRQPASTTEVHPDQPDDADCCATGYGSEMAKRIPQSDGGVLPKTTGPNEQFSNALGGDAKTDIKTFPTPSAVTPVLPLTTDEEDLTAGKLSSSPRTSPSPLAKDIQPVASDTQADTLQDHADATSEMINTAEGTAATNTGQGDAVDETDMTNVEIRTLSPEANKPEPEVSNLGTNEETCVSTPAGLHTSELEICGLEKDRASSTEGTLDSGVINVDTFSTLQAGVAGTRDLDKATSVGGLAANSLPQKEDEGLAETTRSPSKLCISNDDNMQNDMDAKHDNHPVTLESDDTEKVFGLATAKQPLCPAGDMSPSAQSKVPQTNTGESIGAVKDNNRLGDKREADPDCAEECKPHAEENQQNCEDTPSQNSPTGTVPFLQSSLEAREEPVEPQLPEILPTERIDTIRMQIYEEGLKPCQRDGGVAFFIPASNSGLQPAVNNPDLGDRLAKPKKPSMTYEERMLMADINRHNQLSKKKEFAVKDLINVKSATSSSPSGENISGSGTHDRSDNRSERSNSSSWH